MDINLIRITVTVVCFTLFIAITLWAYGPGRREAFAEAARLPLDEDAAPSGEAATGEAP